MPFPIGHTVVGYSVTAASGVRFRRDTLTALLFSVVVANLPDLDFLPGALANEPGLYHRTVAHSLPAALLCGIILAGVITRFRGRFLEMALLGFLVYSSHLFADMVDFGGGNTGVQMLWPISSAWLVIPTPLAGEHASALLSERGVGTEGFAASLFTWHFLRASILQGLFFLPLLAPALWIRSLRERRRIGANREVERDARREARDLPNALGVD